jgi:hypothetical protein
MGKSKITPLFLQTALLILTGAVGLFAMTFTPYERIYTDGVWHTEFRLDPLYSERRVLMTVGLVACVLSLCFLLCEFVRNKWRGGDIVLHLSMILLCCTIGWAAFPYWVNCVFQAYLGLVPMSDFDPKPLITQTWVGRGWPIGVVILFYGSLLAIPLLLLLALVFSLEQKTWLKGIASGLCLALTAAFFFLSPDYWNWFWD